MHLPLLLLLASSVVHAVTTTKSPFRKLSDLFVEPMNIRNSPWTWLSGYIHVFVKNETALPPHQGISVVRPDGGILSSPNHHQTTGDQVPAAASVATPGEPSTTSTTQSTPPISLIPDLTTTIPTTAPAFTSTTEINTTTEPVTESTTPTTATTTTTPETTATPSTTTFAPTTTRTTTTPSTTTIRYRSGTPTEITGMNADCAKAGYSQYGVYSSATDKYKCRDQCFSKSELECLYAVYRQNTNDCMLIKPSVLCVFTPLSGSTLLYNSNHVLQQYDQKDFNGGDIRWSSGEKIAENADKDACPKLCELTPGCKYVTMWSIYCSLKDSSAKAASYADGCTSWLLN